MFDPHAVAPGKTIWQSNRLAALGVEHLFTTRAWNVRSAADVRDVVDQAGWSTRDGRNDPLKIIMAKQVHAHAVSTPGHPLDEADAHVTDDPATAVAVRTADCVPILISSADGRVVAAIHAGWRGLDPAVNVIAHAVAAFGELTADPNAMSDAVAAVGPCISVHRYEVGEEVASRFRPQFPGAVRDDLGGKPHLDTRAVAHAQLRAAGFTDARIDVFPGCTFDDEPSFYSYRRDGKGVGHQAAIIRPRPALGRGSP